MDADFGDQLHASLLSRGFVFEVELESPDIFASWCRYYERRGQRIRLLWDAKDEWFVLQGGKHLRPLAIRTPSELAANGIDEFLADVDLDRVAPPAV